MEGNYARIEGDTYHRIPQDTLRNLMDHLLSGPDALDRARRRGWDDGPGSRPVRLPWLPESGDSGVTLDLIAT